MAEIRVESRGLQTVSRRRQKAMTASHKSATRDKKRGDASIPFTNTQLKEMLAKQMDRETQTKFTDIRESCMEIRGHSSMQSPQIPKGNIVVSSPDPPPLAQTCTCTRQRLEDCLVITRPQTSLRVRTPLPDWIVSANRDIDKDLTVALSINMIKVERKNRPRRPAILSNKLPNEKTQTHPRSRTKHNTTPKQKLCKLLFVTHYGERSAPEHKREANSAQGKHSVNLVQKRWPLIRRGYGFLYHKQQLGLRPSQLGSDSLCAPVPRHLSSRDSLVCRTFMNRTTHNPLNSTSTSTFDWMQSRMASRSEKPLSFEPPQRRPSSWLNTRKRRKKGRRLKGLTSVTDSQHLPQTEQQGQDYAYPLSWGKKQLGEHSKQSTQAEGEWLRKRLRQKLKNDFILERYTRNIRELLFANTFH